MPSKTFKTSETVDFIVVGSGASGGIVARELARAGNSVVVMEQGPRMEAYEFEHDELKYRNLSGITNNPATNPPRCAAISEPGERPNNTNNMIPATTPPATYFIFIRPRRQFSRCND